MFQICFPNQKVQRKNIGSYFFKFLLNAMMGNIKIHNTFYIIEISNL